MLQINKSSPPSNDEPVRHVVAHGMRIRKTGSCRRGIEVKELMALSTQRNLLLGLLSWIRERPQVHRFLRLCR